MFPQTILLSQELKNQFLPMYDLLLLLLLFTFIKKITGARLSGNGGIKKIHINMADRKPLW